MKQKRDFRASHSNTTYECVLDSRLTTLSERFSCQVIHLEENGKIVVVKTLHEFCDHGLFLRKGAGFCALITSASSSSVTRGIANVSSVVICLGVLTGSLS